jgi:site-specific DNA-cytosine methylase
MIVLDLFSGLGGFSQAFKDRGHNVITLDNESRFKPDICKDIMKVTYEDFKDMNIDVILASPPCNCFSPMSIGRYWDNGKPKKETWDAIDLDYHTLGLIIKIHPKYWFLENPMGMLRTVIGNPPVTVFYAQYGENRLKPTDMWGRHPNGFKEMQIKDKSLLDYTPAPRGCRIGTQGMKNSEIRAKIPYKLSENICILCERNL